MLLVVLWLWQRNAYAPAPAPAVADALTPGAADPLDPFEAAVSDAGSDDLRAGDDGGVEEQADFEEEADDEGPGTLRIRVENAKGEPVPRVKVQYAHEAYVGQDDTGFEDEAPPAGACFTDSEGACAVQVQTGHWRAWVDVDGHSDAPQVARVRQGSEGRVVLLHEPAFEFAVRVVDEDGRRVHALIEVGPRFELDRRQAFTGRDGTARFQMTAGEYEVAVERDDSGESQTETVTLDGPRELTVTFRDRSSKLHIRSFCPSGGCGATWVQLSDGHSDVFDASAEEEHVIDELPAGKYDVHLVSDRETPRERSGCTSVELRRRSSAYVDVVLEPNGGNERVPVRVEGTPAQREGLDLMLSCESANPCSKHFVQYAKTNAEGRALFEGVPSTRCSIFMALRPVSPNPLWKNRRPDFHRGYEVKLGQEFVFRLPPSARASTPASASGAPAEP